VEAVFNISTAYNNSTTDLFFYLFPLRALRAGGGGDVHNGKRNGRQTDEKGVPSGRPARADRNAFRKKE